MEVWPAFQHPRQQAATLIDIAIGRRAVDVAILVDLSLGATTRRLYFCFSSATPPTWS